MYGKKKLQEKDKNEKKKESENFFRKYDKSHLLQYPIKGIPFIDLYQNHL